MNIPWDECDIEGRNRLEIALLQEVQATRAG